MLAVLLFLGQSADACVRDLEADDIAARERAVVRLIALEALDAVKPLLASGDAELRSRAQDVRFAVRFLG